MAPRVLAQRSLRSIVPGRLVGGALCLLNISYVGSILTECTHPNVDDFSFHFNYFQSSGGLVKNKAQAHHTSTFQFPRVVVCQFNL